MIVRYSCSQISNDAKPQSNILLDNSFSVKIADFGLTRHSDATATGNPALPFHFAAPELFPDVDDLDSQEESFEPTEKTDVYAFACLYYEVGTPSASTVSR